jgi:peptide/nickel transport system ATP-binding protein
LDNADKSEILISVENLKKTYRGRGRFLRKGQDIPAVDGVSFQVKQGEILGLVGESGCGKTTTGRLLTVLEKPTDGRVLFEGVDINKLKGIELKRLRRKVQMISQDPYASLDPRLTVYETVNEGLVIHKIGTRDEATKLVAEALGMSELRPPEEFFDRYPHELSGGQRQRVAFARCMILRPAFLIADEAVSMLDASIRSGIMKLMLKSRKECGISILFITHDLSVARYMSDRIAIMYLGKIVEIGPTDEVILKPLHPYAKILLSAVPIPDPTNIRERIRIPGEAFYHGSLIKGCRFRPRCPIATDKCEQHEPELTELPNEHFVACHLRNLS